MEGLLILVTLMIVRFAIPAALLLVIGEILRRRQVVHPGAR